MNGELVTVEHDGFSVTSNTRSAEEMTAGLVHGDSQSSPPAQVSDSTPHVTSADAPDDSSQDAAPETNPVTEAAKTLNKAKRDKVQERIDKSVAAQRAAERERDAFKAQLESLKAAPKPTQPEADKTIENATATAKADAMAALPSLNEYDSIEAWQSDVAAMIRKQALEDFRAERQRELAEQAQAAKIQTVRERIEAFKADHADYDAVLAAAPQVDIPPVAFDYLQDSEFGPQLAYELAKDAALLSRIASLSPAHAVAALAKLEGKIEARQDVAASGSTPRLVVSNAKPPIKPLGSSPVVADAAPDEMPFGLAYVQAMNHKDRQARRLR